MASQYHSALSLCAVSHRCSGLANSLVLGTPVVSLLVTLTVVVPCLMGVFWGGPLVARELESGTNQLAWTQGISRRRWLAAKVGWALLAAAAWGGAVSALVTWWSGPENALKAQNFQPSQFDIQGIVPIGYAVFAVALGITVGALLRRTVPAMAITVVVFTFLRLLIGQDFRSRYMTPVTRVFSFLPQRGPHLLLPSGSYWMVSGGIVSRAGRELVAGHSSGPGLNIDGIPVPLASLPRTCQQLIFSDPLQFGSCVAAHGYRLFMTYQPANRYWAFQGIETGIYVAMAAVLIAVTAIVVLRRDA
jgi:hypothetical protein